MKMNWKREKIGLIMGLMVWGTACTSMDDDGFRDAVKYTDPETVSLNTDVQTLSERLSFKGEAEESRLAVRSVACPEIPADAFLLKDAPTNYNDGVTLQAGRKYLVEEGETFRGTLSGESSDGVTVYVAGTFEVSAWWLNGKDIRIVVLPTGTFRYASDLYNTSMALIKEGVTVDCWGTFAALHEGSGIRILRKASMNIYRSGHASSLYLNPKGGMWESSFWVEGSFMSERPVIIEGNMLVSGGEVVFHDELQVSKELYVQGGTLQLNDCATVEEDLKFPAAGTLVVGKYLNVRNLEADKGTVRLAGNSLLRVVENLSLTHNNRSTVSHTSDRYAVVEAKRVFVENPELSLFLSGRIDIHAEEFLQGNPWWYAGSIEPDTQGTSGVIIGGNTRLPEDGCRPGVGSSDEEEEISLKEVASLLPPAGYYSATCVSFNGKLAYVSWHTNPKKYTGGFGGVVDVVNISDRQVVQSWNNQEINYNHLLFDDSHLFIAGGSNRFGAVLSCVQLKNGLFSGDREEKLVLLTGSSGNCVALVDNILITASGGEDGGFDLFSPDVPGKQFSMPVGYAKAAYSDGKKLVTLNDTELGTVNVYDVCPGWQENLAHSSLLTFHAGPIVPQDGKNVIMCDDEYVYVCMGDNGLRAFDIHTGAEAAAYDIKKVNGMDIDGDYIYVANGYGITVLEKEGLSYVSSYVDNSGSANYVKKGEDGYIYVAYGIRGFRVFKLE